MKVPLEPIPTEQIVLVKQKPPTGGLRAPDGRGDDHVSSSADTGQLEKAYPWLLGVSTCLSALLCWMYVTKPVIVQDASANSPALVSPVGQMPEMKIVEKKDAMASQAVEPVAAELVPSDNQLPRAGSGGKHAVSANPKSVAGQGAPVVIDPRLLNSGLRGAAEPGVGLGWEKTNLKVQHILTADAGSGEHEKIVINVPVLYETRSMRWTPDHVEKAREVLARLMLYERNLSNLRKEGSAILADWNELLKETVPAGSLRADSPSLPYNHGQGHQTGTLPESSSAIKVENK